MLAVVIYNDHNFKKNPLSKDIQKKIYDKKEHLKTLAYRKYGVKADIPILISDKMPDNLFGLAVYTKKKEIKIILNKNRFQESVEYMIDYVLPHEYAHALMFYFKDFSSENGGHTKRWQQVCLELEGKKCDRYVKHKDVIYGKVPF
jgi:Zn-dependent peptidase ImmA (M78 family)